MVPHSLRQRAVDIAHEANLGIQKTKALLREKVCFPQIHNVVKITIEKCITCQAVASPNPPEPLAMTQMPKSQLEVLNIDVYGPLPTGEYLLVVIDRYSRFPEVEIFSSTKASVVIPKLNRIFAVHGIPAIVRSINGPPFNGKDYSRYLQAWGVKVEWSTPKWLPRKRTCRTFYAAFG